MGRKRSSGKNNKKGASRASYGMAHVTAQKGSGSVDADTRRADGAGEAADGSGKAAVDEFRAEIALGSKVMLWGLSAAHMNDRYATVESLATRKDRARCRVALLIGSSDNLDHSVAPMLIKHDNLEVVCNYCGALNPPNRCSRCHGASYCNHECQVAGWGTHKNVCKEILEQATKNKEERKQWELEDLVPAITVVEEGPAEVRVSRDIGSSSSNGSTKQEQQGYADATLKVALEAILANYPIQSVDSARIFQQVGLISMIAEYYLDRSGTGGAVDVAWATVHSTGEDATDLAKLVSMGFDKVTSKEALRSARTLGASGTDIALRFLSNSSSSSSSSLGRLTKAQRIVAHMFHKQPRPLKMASISPLKSLGFNKGFDHTDIDSMLCAAVQVDNEFAAWMVTPEAAAAVGEASASFARMRSDVSFRTQMEQSIQGYRLYMMNMTEAGDNEASQLLYDFSNKYSKHDLQSLGDMGFSQKQVRQALSSLACRLFNEKIRENGNLDATRQFVNEFMASERVSQERLHLAIEILSEFEGEQGESGVGEGGQGIAATITESRTDDEGQEDLDTGTVAAATTSSAEVATEPAPEKQLEAKDLPMLADIMDSWTLKERMDFMEAYNISQHQIGMLSRALYSSNMSRVQAILTESNRNGTGLDLSRFVSLLRLASKEAVSTSFPATDPALSHQVAPTHVPTAYSLDHARGNEKVKLMPDEKAAICRLTELGVSIGSAMKAFQESGAHEQRAANILLNWMAEGLDLGSPPEDGINTSSSQPLQSPDADAERSFFSSSFSSLSSSSLASAAAVTPDILQAAADGTFDLDDVN